MAVTRLRNAPNVIYCPYTDRELPREMATTEHVIPLALGGINGLTLPVDSRSNSTLGSELDGALANEFFVAMRRSEYDARGHSGKEPWAIATKATLDESERPIQVHIHRRHGIKLWDPRDKQMKPLAGALSLRTTLNIYLPVRFTAKVALAAGYFVYGDQFRHHVDHRQLRELMRTDLARFAQSNFEGDHPLKHLTLRADHYLGDPPSEEDWQLKTLRRFCSATRGSIIILFPGNNYLGVSVGILGKFLATLIVPAQTKTFPNEGPFAWGHVLAVISGTLYRCSWADALKQCVKHSEK